MFFLGLVLVFLGIQFRLVKTYELKPSVTQFIEAQIAERLASSSPTQATASVSNDDLWANFPPTPPPIQSNCAVTPPSWLAWTFISMGSVLVLVCPCYR